MWSDYFFYLIGLPESERNTQILVIISFWCILLIVGTMTEKIKKNLVNKFLQKYCKKITLLIKYYWIILN